MYTFISVRMLSLTQFITCFPFAVCFLTFFLLLSIIWGLWIVSSWSYQFFNLIHNRFGCGPLEMPFNMYICVVLLNSNMRRTNNMCVFFESSWIWCVAEFLHDWLKRTIHFITQCSYILCICIYFFSLLFFVRPSLMRRWLRWQNSRRAYRTVNAWITKTKWINFTSFATCRYFERI